MAQKKVRAAIVSQEKLAEGIFSMWLDAPEMAAASRPGPVHRSLHQRPLKTFTAAHQYL